MKKAILITILFFVCFAIPILLFYADEGMFPISEIQKINLEEKGLKITPKDIFNPDGISLIDAIVRVGGCTGSFVSQKGLILTNHHCAYGVTQAASTKENDYIQNGFLAKNYEQEIEAKGMTARITDSYKDVSSQVLKVVKKKMGLAERTKAIEKQIKKIVASTEKKNPGKRAEIAEMFPGKSYILFIYTYLKDIRLVYVPPRSIGEFGGETDNWMWPRHTGDFSFLRAYSAPDGSPAEFSKNNIPYEPEKFLNVNPDGVKENDFVFILGYPGRTYRHKTSYYLAYEKNFRMPYVADWYQEQINIMEKMGAEDRAVAIKHLSRIKGLSNTMKNYRGKLLGMNRLSLVNKVREREQELQSFIEADSNRKKNYGNVLTNISKIYEDISSSAERQLILNYLRSSVKMINFAFTVYEASIERKKIDIERESNFMDRNFSRTKKRLFLSLDNYYEPTDRQILKELLKRAFALPKEQRITPLEKHFSGEEKEIDKFIDHLYSGSELSEKENLQNCFSKDKDTLESLNDPFLNLVASLYPEYLKIRERNKARKGALDPLHAQYLEVKKLFLNQNFIPDANRTLRMTFGRIKGYQPVDATTYNPITTTAGVLEKTTGKEPFDTPESLVKLIESRDFGRFALSKSKGVPVCILYDMDTTGGNSGSPVLDAYGNMVGINFDRAFEATINDYAWSEEYSRSIAVDIRYVLWVTEKFGGAKHLLNEMGIPGNL